MNTPDFTKVKTEREFMLWLVEQKNPGLSFLPDELIFIEPFLDDINSTVDTVEARITQRRPGNRPTLTKPIEYERVLVTSLLENIDVSLVGPPTADNIIYLARRVLVREFRKIGIDFDPICAVEDKVVTTENDTTTLTGNAVFNSQCLYGTLPVKVVFTADPAATVKTLAPVTTLVLTDRDLVYRGLQYGDLSDVADVNEQLKIIYGAVVRHNPDFVGYFPSVGKVVPAAPGWNYATTTVKFTDSTNTTVIITVPRVNIRDHHGAVRGEVLAKYQQTPTYYSTGNSRKSRFCTMYNEYFVDIKKMPPVIETLSTIDAGKTTNGYTSYTFMANDYIYQGYNPDSLRFVAKPDIDKIKETSLVGVLLTDVIDG